MDRVTLWKVVEQRARQVAADCRTAVEQARLKVEKLQSNHSRINGLYGDYNNQRQQQESVAHQVSSTAEIRQTQRQLLFLENRVSQELQAARKEYQAAQARLEAADQHCLKMQKMVEQAEAAQRKDDRLREQKLLDQSAMARYRLREHGAG